LANKKGNKDSNAEKKEEKTIDKAKIKNQINTQLAEEKPKDVKTLVDLITQKYQTPKEDIIQVLQEEEFKGELTFREPKIEPVTLPGSLKEYLFVKHFFSVEFWATIALVTIMLVLTLIDVQTGFFFYLRYVIVCVVMLILSGWTWTAALFPELDEKLRFMERFVTAIGLSVLILILDALFINYTFGFNNVAPVTISLSIFTVLGLIIAIILRLKIARDGFIIKPKEKETLEVDGGES
jgi:hypothetical protein